MQCRSHSRRRTSECLFVTACSMDEYAEEKTTEKNLIVRKPKQLIMKDCARRFVLKLYRHEASSGLFATAELLVISTGWAKKTGLFLRLDNFATTSNRKTCNMTKVLQFCLELNAFLHVSAVKYSLPNLHKSSIPPKLHWIWQWRMSLFNFHSKYSKTRTISNTWLVQTKFNMTTICIDNHFQSFLAADQSLDSVCPGLAEPMSRSELASADQSKILWRYTICYNAVYTE